MAWEYSFAMLMWPSVMS